MMDEFEVEERSSLALVLMFCNDVNGSRKGDGTN